MRIGLAGGPFRISGLSSSQTCCHSRQSMTPAPICRILTSLNTEPANQAFLLNSLQIALENQPMTMPMNRIVIINNERGSSRVQNRISVSTKAVICSANTIANTRSKRLTISFGCIGRTPVQDYCGRSNVRLSCVNIHVYEQYPTGNGVALDSECY